jgi:hypothetical protein
MPRICSNLLELASRRRVSLNTYRMTDELLQDSPKTGSERLRSNDNL